MNDIAEVNSSLNEYGFESYSFPAEVAEHDDLQALDLEFCKFAQATGTNYIEMCKRVAAIHAKLARAGRYGGGQWLAWCKIRGLGKDTAYRMTTIGDNFNVRNLSTLNTLQLENMPKSLLYAASKNNVSPVTWELLSSSDPQDVEIGKGLLEAEKHLDTAREEFRLALDISMLKLEKRITLHTFDVEYIDQREPKPRAVHHELCVLDGGRVSALERLGQSPASWICQQYARQGFTVGAVHKGERLTANVDTATLWGMAVQQAGTQHKSAAPDPVDRNCAPAGKFVNPLPNLPPVPDFAEAVTKSKADAARLHEIAAELAAKSAQLERSAKA